MEILVLAQATHDVGVDDVVDHILHTWQAKASAASTYRACGSGFRGLILGLGACDKLGIDVIALLR